MTIDCPHTPCTGKIPIHERHCPVCRRDAGFPNVRAAEDNAEKNALAERLKSARASASARGVLEALENFGVAAGRSQAVMNRSLAVLHSWVNGTNPLFLTFHQQVRGQGRSPQDNDWDQQRISAENTISPFYFEHLSIAALSLDETGMTYYGPYSVQLKEQVISHRASVFEENPFQFNLHHAVISGRPPPPGYRAPWTDRGILAMAKLQPKIVKETDPRDYPGILLERRQDAADCDFIEVHIYEQIHTAAIEKVRGPVPAAPADRQIWRQVKRKLKELGAAVEES